MHQQSIKNIALLIGVCFLGMSFIKPGQLKKIEKCQLNFDVRQVFPGNTVDISVLTLLKDSVVINSAESNGTINFSDYRFNISGGASIQTKNRKKIKIKISDNFYANPAIKVSLSLRRNPAIKHEIDLPILYDIKQKVVFKGRDGYDPRATTDNGYRKIPLTDMVNIEFIDNEKTLTNNSDPNIIGGKGPDLDVYVSLITAENKKEYLAVEIRHELGGIIKKYLHLGVGSLEIQSLGGKGGISRTGGEGGQGGNITVFITPQAKPHFNQIFIANYGGDGGQLWRPKIDGIQHGPYGNDGEVKIVSWEK